MFLLKCVLLFVLLMISDGLSVKGPSAPLVVPVGGSVVLNCSSDELLPVEGLEVEWRRRDSETLVHLFSEGKSREEVQQQEHQGRAHFFTDQIPQGNFSLLLERVRAEDQGEYTCKVYSGEDSAETVVQIRDVERLMVSGSDVSVSAYVGEDVTLNCSVDSHEDIDEVSWKKREKDGDVLVLLYQDSEVKSDSSDERYRDRVQFFSAETSRGNFSVRLKSVRTEDKGVYMCQVFAGDLQANATVTINRLGLSALYVLVLLLSSSASAAVLLFSALIYCRSHSSGFFVGPTRHGVPEGGSVILPCHVHNPPHTPLKVEWRRKDQEAGVILLYGGGKSGEGVQQQEHQGRARLFTDQIPQGNFSLLLERVRAEDQGEYTCKVYSGEDEVFSSDTLVVELRLLGPVFGLQMCLVFWPNLLMALAFLVWGVCEGSLGEMMGCCALYLLRPLMLLWTAPYHTSFSGRVRTWIQDAYFTEYTLFSAVFYSVLFKSAWDKSLNYAEFEGVLIVIIFIIVLLCNIAFIVYLVVRFLGKLSERVTAVFVVLARVSFDVLPSLQFILLFYAFGSARGGFFIVAILPVFLTATRYNWERTCGEKMGCSALLRRSVWLTVMMMVNTLMLYFYIIALEKQKDRYGWASMIAFLQCLWALVNLTYSFTCELRRLTSVYVFGSVVVVLLNSTALTTELTLKTLSGEGVLGDLRVVSFSSDFLFTFPLLILLIFQPWIKPCRSPPQTSERHEETSEVPNHTTTESHELDRLMKAEDVEDGLSEEVT